MKILSNGCLQYLFQEIAYAKLIIANGRADFADAFQFVLISRRYFVEVFSNKIYVYHLTPVDAVLQLDEDENNREKQGFLQLLQVEFRIRAAGGYRGICRQRPLITLLKLVQAITEVEPCNGRDQYVVSVDDRNLEQSLYLMRNLYANRIPTVYLPNGGRYVMIEEFYDTISNDFSYHPRRLFGRSRALSYMGADADDPRVFQVVTVCDPQETTYDPFIFNIKTEKLCVHLSSVEECECLPYMPHLKMLECDYVPLGVFNNSGIDTYYEELSEKLAEAAPNLERLHLSCEVHAFCDTLRLAEEGTVQAGLAIHNSIKGLQSKIKKVGCSVEIIVRSNDDSVLDEVDDVCDHFRQKIKDNFKKAGITSSVDWDEVFFDLWSVEEGDPLLEKSQGRDNFLIFEVF